MLVDNLIRQVGSDNGVTVPEGDLLGGVGGGGADMAGGYSQQQGGGGGRLSMTQQALRNQDQMIDELASGVGRLKEQTLMVHDETNMQNRMLDTVRCLFYCSLFENWKTRRFFHWFVCGSLCFIVVY